MKSYERMVRRNGGERRKDYERSFGSIVLRLNGEGRCLIVGKEWSA